MINNIMYPLSTRTCNLSTQFCKVFLFLVFLQIIEYSAVYGRKAKPRGERHPLHQIEDTDTDELWGTDPMTLLDFSDDDLMSTREYTNEINFGRGRKRVIRSPLDDEIDEVEDSDEDDDNDEEENQYSMTKTTTPVSANKSVSSSTTNGSVHVLTKTNETMNITKNVDNNSTTAKNQSVVVAHVHPRPNGFPYSSPPGRHLKPGVLPPPPTHGGAPILKLPPGAVPPVHGKLPLPPHLLKNLPKPKPPPKKGELYLPEDYNNLVIPKLNLGKLIGIESYSAVPVLVFLNIRSVRDIDESMETLTLDLDLVIEWVDGFLFDPISAITTRQADITLNPIFLKKIWRPDIYIDEIVKVKRTSLMSKPLKLKFNPSNGFISYTTRLTVQLSCDMLYFYYPADTHRCEFTFRSYSYFSKDMELSWLGTGVYLQDPYDPNFDLQVESIDLIKLPQTFRRLTNDTFDGLKFTLLARRKLSFHMVQTYLPSIFFIVITWLCFLVPARMVEARIGISMTTLLTLTSMFASVRESTPIVSYVKAIDIWMVFCIFFVFLTLLEFATLVWLRSRREEAEEKKLEQQRKDQENRGKGKDLESNLSYQRSSSHSEELYKYERFAEFTEKFAFLIFSIVFIIFNIIYWSWLLIASDYFDWSVNSTLNADLD